MFMRKRITYPEREVTGRKADFVVTPDGHYVHCAFFERIFGSKREVYQFQIHQTDLKHIELRFICNQKKDQAWMDNVKKELRERLGGNMEINISMVDHIELTKAGKHRHVISEVKPEHLLEDISARGIESSPVIF